MLNRTICLGVLAAGFLLADSYAANAVVYCKYVGVPKGCVAKAGVVLVPAPVVRPAPAARAVVRPGRGVNLGGPVNRAGVR
jgi:hypothetical protein